MAFWNKKNKKELPEEIKEDKKNTQELPEVIKEDKKILEKKPVKETTTTTKTLGRNIYYVSARKDKTGKKVGWEVKKENATKVTRIVSTKTEALEIVKELAGHQESTVIIRKVDGSIQETLKFKNK